MANFLNGFLDNVINGATNPKGNLADWRHAAYLYNTNAFRLSPKVKFLYHVVFNLNPDCPAVQSSSFRQQHMTSIGMLVKEAELPKFKISTETPNQYNKKKVVQTKLEYDPVQIVFHDDNLGVTTQLWSLYYSYYFADSSHAGSIGSGDGFARSQGSLAGAAANTSGTTSGNTPAAYQRNSYWGEQRNGYRYGLDNNQTVPFFTSIQIFQLTRKTYQAFTLVNPIISSWQHDRMQQSGDGEIVQSTMNINYESVFYGQGAIGKGNPKGFATEMYDNMPSPLSLQGGGTTSIFGPGGVAGGLGTVLGDLTNPETFKDPTKLLGAAIKGANLIKNVKGLTKEGLKQEGASILKGAIGGLVGANVGTGPGGIPGVVIPKSIGNGQSQFTQASGPVESIGTNSLNVGNLLTQGLSSNPSATGNLVSAVGRLANIPGVPTTSADFLGSSSAAQNTAISAVSNSYDAGNTKVVGLVNKFIGGLG